MSGKEMSHPKEVYEVTLTIKIRLFGQSSMLRVIFKVKRLGVWSVRSQGWNCYCIMFPSCSK